jgi:Resolvase, N terminal domain
MLLQNLNESGNRTFYTIFSASKGGLSDEARCSLAASRPQTTERELREVAGCMGCEIVKVYKGSRHQRRQGQREAPCIRYLCRDATKRQFDMVMAWSVDRLGRSLPKPGWPLIIGDDHINSAGLPSFRHSAR